MDFEALKENITSLVDFVRPLAGLISDFYQAAVTKLPTLGMAFDVVKKLLLVGIVAGVYKRLANK